MSPEQATHIAKRIINTMRPTPALVEWVEVLGPLDFDAALKTFRDLVDRLDGGLRIAAWNAAYARRTGTAPPEPVDAARGPRAGCEHCGGTGFEPGPPEYEQVAGEPHEYSTVVPCRCRRSPAVKVPARTPDPLPFPDESLTRGDLS